VQASFLLGSRQDFSAGVDLREVAKNPHLVTMLQRMAIICASYQKPLFTFLEGEVSGSAVSLVSNLEYVYATPEAKAVFDSVKRGWVLEAGGSYYLSRMPNAYGRFLVLTGAEIGAA
jgi:enoyl-CoA hydratase/carnithine racemase